MKLSKLTEMIREILAEQDVYADDTAKKELETGQALATDSDYNKKWKDTEAELDKPRPDYQEYSRDKAAATQGEANDLEDNIPPSEDETTPDRKTAVLMQKFGHDPLYKAIIDAEDKEAVVVALNKLTKEKGLYAATYFLGYYKRLGAGSNSAAIS